MAEFKRGNWVMVQTPAGEQIGVVAKLTTDGRAIVHFILPDGTTKMRFDEVVEKEITAGIVVGFDKLRKANREEIPESRRPLK